MLSSPQLSIWRACQVGAAGITMTLTMAAAARGQNLIIPDATLGPGESSIVESVGGGLFDVITGGAVREQNLFHSFSEFNVGEENGAIFIVGGDAIANILARVTGNNISEIGGFIATVQSSNGDVGSTDANLFLLNPNGIVFGENAFVSVDGSFYATTAEAIELGEQVFSATNLAQSALLAVDPSTVFTNYLTDNSGNIENRGFLSVPENLTLAANQITLQDSSTTAENNLTLQATNGLSILSSRVRLRDSAGDLLIQGGDISIIDSAVEVPGSGGLDNDLTLQATNDISIQNSDVVLFNSTGDLLVEGKDIFITDGNIFTIGPGTLGKLTLAAENQVEILSLEESVGVSSFVDGPESRSSDISITAANLSVINSNNQSTSSIFIDTSANNGGDSGNITIDVDNFILFDGAKLTTLLRGDTARNTGNIQITATDIDILNGTQIETDVSFSNENLNTSTGDIIISATGNLRMTGVDQGIDFVLYNFITTSVSNQGNGDAGSILISANRLEIDDLGSISTSITGRGNAGNIEIAANQLEFKDGASVSSISSGQGAAGDIVLNITGTASFDGTFLIDPALTDQLPEDIPDFVREAIENSDPNTPVATGLFARALGSGAGGNIQLQASNLAITNGAVISASTNGPGDAGNITLDIEDIARIDGRTDDGINPSFIEADSGQGATGNGGDLRITANQLNVTGGAQLTSSLSGTGTAGDIFVEADTVLIQGFDANAAASLTEEPRSGIINNIQDTGQGIAGDVVITANNFILVDGGTIDASVFGNGDGGDIILNIADTARIIGVDPNGSASLIGSANNAREVGSAGDIVLSAGSLEVLDGGQILNSNLKIGKAGVITLDIVGTVRVEGTNPVLPDRPSGVFSTTESESSGGDLRIFAQDLEILDGAILNTSSLAEGASGNVFIDLRGTLRADDGEITTASNETSGGRIDIEAQAIRLFGDSDIRTDVELGTGRGGNITLKANAILLFNDSDILAFSATGEGGNILLDTPVFFGENFQPADQLSTRQELVALDGNSRVDVNATGRVASGDIDLPDLENITNRLTELPSNLFDPEALIAGSCVAANNNTNGSFAVTRDGIAQQPGENSVSSYSTGTVQPLDDRTVVQIPQEPQGIYPLADGRLVLSQEC